MVIPTYGKHQLTRAVVRQLTSEEHTVVMIIDNLGDSALRASGCLQVVAPNSNLGWLASCNLGIEACMADFPNHLLVLLNNDVVLSKDFVQGLLTAASHGDVIGPMYDDLNSYQWGGFFGKASEYRPRAEERDVPFIDGTCLAIRPEVVRVAGGLSDCFGLTGWGADIEYCIRTRRLGFRVVATRRSYMNHLRAVTASTVLSQYRSTGIRDMEAGLLETAGPDWRREAFGSPHRAALRWVRIRHRSLARRFRRMRSTPRGPTAA